MNLIRKVQKRMAIRSYLRRLPRLLAKDYGRSTTYTPRQVRSTIDRSGLSAIYSCYGVAIFSTREAFASFHAGIGETCDFDAMRAEVAHFHFGDNVDFTAAEIADTFSEHGPTAGHDVLHHGGSGDGHTGH